MKQLIGTLVSVHTQADADPDARPQESMIAELDGLVGEAHRGFSRVAESYDPDPTGTVRRNERQWSGVSMEELAVIRERMGLREPLAPETLCANICVEGIPRFSQLPRGSRLLFPSGAALLVEEGNPPCSYIGERIETRYTTASGKPASGRLFPKSALGLRGVVGVVDIAGVLALGDRIVVQVFEPPEG
jgi:hypothetical protein